MRVFVTGTGRCGTLTFYKACQQIQNMTCGHETKAGCSNSLRFVYPPDHIEVDPHLAWTSGPIIRRYPDAYYVHLQRSREAVVESWLRRGIQPHAGAAPLIDVIFQTVCCRKNQAEYREALGLLYDVVNENLAEALKHVSSTHVWLHEIHQGFEAFWHDVQAEGDLSAATKALSRRWNASPQPRSK